MFEDIVYGILWALLGLVYVGLGAMIIGMIRESYLIEDVTRWVRRISHSLVTKI